MYTLSVKKQHKYLLFTLSLIISNQAIALCPTTFTVSAVTSAFYNPVLPVPLDVTTALNNMTWDNVPGTSQNKSSNWNHSGGWLGFVVDTYASNVFNCYPKYRMYNNTIPTYFGTSVNGNFRRDIYWGSLNAGYTFTAVSSGLPAVASMYVK